MHEDASAKQTVAILIHDMFEDWLESVGVPLEEFCTRATGSWWFNYAQALRGVGVGTVLICTSSRVSSPERFIHGPTGAVFWALPAPKTCKFIRWLLVNRLGDAAATRSRVSAWLSRTRHASGRHLASYFSTPLSLVQRALTQERCSCVLVEEYEFPRFDVAVLLGWRMNLPVFGTFCGAMPQGVWRRPLRPLALRLCSGLVICARSEAERVMKRYAVPAKKVTLLYYPIDFSVWYPGDKQESRAVLSIPPDARVVAYHGAITLWTKGIAVLVEAWERLCLARRDIDLRLILIGTGVDEAELSQILEEKRLPGVQWLNEWVSDRSLIQRYLSAADVYVFPSRGDACGISIIEAMACGLPVVASKIRGIPDLLPEGELSGGSLIEPGDAAVLAEAMGRMLDDTALSSALGERARQHAEANFSMEAIGKLLSDVLLVNTR